MTPLRWIFGVLVFLCALPVLAMLVATTVGGAAGCRVDESGAHPCVVLGADVGGLLYASFTSAWLALVTLPVGAAVAALWIVIEIIAALRRRKRTGPRREGAI